MPHKYVAMIFIPAVRLIYEEKKASKFTKNTPTTILDNKYPD